MISELYVRAARPAGVHGDVREDARRHAMNIIYGTMRLIERDDESVLAWAREPWACIVFNLHVDHCPSGIRKAEHDFRRLIDRAAESGWQLLPDVSPLGHAGSGRAMPSAMREFLDSSASTTRRDVHERLVHSITCGCSRGSRRENDHEPDRSIVADRPDAGSTLRQPCADVPRPTAEQQVTLYELVLRDGSRLYGTIERKRRTKVVFRTQAARP